MQERRLIDAEALLQDMANLYGKSFSYADYCSKIISAVHCAPTIDAVEVVKCEKCMHWMHDVAGCTENIGRCEFANYFVGANGYCVYGERKEGLD